MVPVMSEHNLRFRAALWVGFVHLLIPSVTVILIAFMCYVAFTQPEANSEGNRVFDAILLSLCTLFLCSILYIVSVLIAAVDLHKKGYVSRWFPQIP